MKKLRIAIIGCKNMGRKHLACLQEYFADRVKISGILNSTFTSTQIAAQELGVRAFEGIQKINHKNTDAVIVATPMENHYETTKTLLNKGFPLLVEKPFSETFEQCLELSKIAKDKKIPLLVGHTENYNPAVIMLKKQLSAPIKSIAVVRTSQNSGEKKSHIISELMIHDLAIVQSLIKGDWVEARIDKQDKYRWDEHAVVEMKYYSGAIVKLEALRHPAAELKRQMRIIDAHNNIWTILFVEKELRRNNELLCAGGNSLKNELEYFLDMLTNKTISQASLDDACNVVKLCNELESIKS